MVTKPRRASSRRWITNSAARGRAGRWPGRGAAGILLHADDREIDGDRQDFEIAAEQQRIAEIGEAFDEDEQERVESPGAISGSVTVVNVSTARRAASAPPPRDSG
jgi:hypothetical protein